jgi:Fe-S oxidoreductase
MDIHIELAEVGCCQRPRISNGFLHLAKSESEKLFQKLKPFLNENKPLIVCEPSCISALKYDLPDLMDDTNHAQTMISGFIPVADYIWDKMKTKYQTNLNIKRKNIYLHGHCHEKALFSITSIRGIIENSGGKINIIDSGCCGMAGAFGYEKEHYEISQKIGRNRLFNAIEKTPPDSFIIANGFSCRHQIEHFTGRKAHFWTEVFE